MYCGNCGGEVQEGVIACSHCGFPPRIQKKFCFGCGTEVQPDQFICSKCGLWLEKPDELEEPDELEKPSEQGGGWTEFDIDVDQRLANQIRRKIPVSEWIALVILSYFALVLASETLIGGLILGAVIWMGYSHSFEKQKKILLDEMREEESDQNDW